MNRSLTLTMVDQGYKYLMPYIEDYFFTASEGCSLAELFRAYEGHICNDHPITFTTTVQRENDYVWGLLFEIKKGGSALDSLIGRKQQLTLRRLIFLMPHPINREIFYLEGLIAILKPDGRGYYHSLWFRMEYNVRTREGPIDFPELNNP